MSLGVRVTLRSTTRAGTGRVLSASESVTVFRTAGMGVTSHGGVGATPTPCTGVATGPVYRKAPCVMATQTVGTIVTSHRIANKAATRYRSLRVERETALTSDSCATTTATAATEVTSISVPSVPRTSFSAATKRASAASSSVMAGQTVKMEATRVKGPGAVSLQTSAAAMDTVLGPSKSVMGTWTVTMGRMRGPAVSWKQIGLTPC